MASKRVIGAKAESFAAGLVRSKGYKILETNFRSKVGEVDIIAKEGGELVFIEVKARHSLKYGYPEEAVTQHKINKIKRTADLYIKEYRLDYKNIRIDVVSLLFEKGQLVREKIIKHVF